jgi:hypothetical protein
VKRRNWLATLGISFLLLSIVIYSIHFLIFGDSLFIFKYVVAQLGFLPLSTLLVTIVLNQLMGRREKNIRMQKLNMVIGVFFSDVGTDLIRVFTTFDRNSEQFGQELIMNSSWTSRDFERVKAGLPDIRLDVKSDKALLVDLKSYLSIKKPTLLRLMENPNLLEHETFSELLRTVSHLTEELDNRKDLNNLPPSDYAHLRNDIWRVYVILISQWLDYCQHLHKKYPYLFSLAIRTNPFNPEASAEVNEITE